MIQVLPRKSLLGLHLACAKGSRRVFASSTLRLSSDRSSLFRHLGLQKFSDDEIKNAFGKLYPSDSINVSPELDRLATAHKLKQENGNRPSIENFKTSVIALGEKLDGRVWPLSIGFLATGISIGVMTPCLPIIANELTLTAAQLGIVVSSYGFAKLISNIPTAYWADKYGRKPVAMGGMALTALSIGSVGLCLIPELGVNALIASRMAAGLGIAAFSSAGVMMLTDTSTMLNRTRTMAPVMASLQIGMALGPAVGGLALHHLGIAPSFVVVGSALASLTALNQVIIQESRPDVIAAAPPTDASTAKPLSPLQSALSVWGKLLKRPEIRNVVAINTVYWAALAGVNLTLLPLLMMGPGLHLDAATMGLVFAGTSMASVAAAQPIAWVADKYGKSGSIAAGKLLMGAGVAGLTQVVGFESLCAALLPLSLGYSILSTVPTAYIGDLTSPPERAQALALLRSAGDVGFLAGAAFSGLLSDATDIPTALAANTSLLAISAGLWSARGYFNSPATPQATAASATSPKKE